MYRGFVTARFCGLAALALCAGMACARAAPSEDTKEAQGSAELNGPERGGKEARQLGEDDVIDLGAIGSSDRLDRLEPLFKDTQIVLLGEATHGDGASRTAMATLLRYLHEEQGFDVFAVEGGLYSCSRAWERAKRGESAMDVAASWSNSVYRDSEPMRRVWEYLAARAGTDSPLELTGFDNRPTGDTSELAQDLAVALEELGVKHRVPEGWRSDFEGAVSMLRTLPPPARTDEERERHREALRTPLDAIRSTDAEPGVLRGKWVRVLEGFMAREHDFWLYHQQGEVITDDQVNLRDEQLAANLVWLLNERHPGQRIVVWAGNLHTIFNFERVGPLDHGDHVHEPEEFVPTAERLLEHLPRHEVLSITFVGIEGKRGLPHGEVSALPEPPAGSFEAAAASTGLDYGLVDLRRFRGSDHWLGGAFPAAALGGEHLEAPWASTMDALAFIRTMTPNAALEAEGGE